VEIVQSDTTFAVTATVVVDVVADASVVARPSAKNPTTAMDNTDRAVFDHFMEMTPCKKRFRELADIITL
jgi:hypothetical protein